MFPPGEVILYRCITSGGTFCVWKRAEESCWGHPWVRTVLSCPRWLWLEREGEWTGALGSAPSLGTGWSFWARTVERRRPRSKGCMSLAVGMNKSWRRRKARGCQTHQKHGPVSGLWAWTTGQCLSGDFFWVFLEIPVSPGLLRARFLWLSISFPNALFVIFLTHPLKRHYIRHHTRLWPWCRWGKVHACPPSSEFGPFKGSKGWFQDLRAWVLTVPCSKKACTESKRREPGGFSRKIELEKDCLVQTSNSRKAKLDQAEPEVC